MSHYVLLFTNTILFIYGVFCNEWLSKSVTPPENLLYRYKAVHKALTELTQAKAQEALLEEKARIQKVIEQEAKNAYERDTGEEMVQMINAKITSLRAEQALKKVVHAQEVMRNINREVFQSKLKSNELARRLIQVENDLVNAQIEYISTNNESGMYDEKCQNYGQDLLDFLSIKYLMDTPQENIAIKNDVKKLNNSTLVPSLNSSQYNLAPAYNYKQLSSGSSSITKIIPKNLSIDLLRSGNVRVLNNQSLLNSSFNINPSLNFSMLLDGIPHPPVQLTGKNFLGKFEPSYSLGEKNYPWLRNQSIYFNSGTNCKVPQNDLQIPFSQAAQLIPDQNTLITDSNLLGDTKLLHSELLNDPRKKRNPKNYNFKTGRTTIMSLNNFNNLNMIKIKNNFLDKKSENPFNVSQFPLRKNYPSYKINVSNVNKDPLHYDNLRYEKLSKNYWKQNYNNPSINYNDINRNKRVSNSSNFSALNRKPSNLFFKSSNQDLNEILPKIMFHNDSPKRDALKYVKTNNSEIDVRDILADLKSRKYIKRWNK